MRRIAPWTAAAVFLSVLPLTGCNTESVESADAEPSAADADGLLAGPAVDGEGDHTTGDEDDSAWRDADDPLVAFLGFDPAAEPDVVAAHDATEKAQAACMADAGLEYVPRPFDAGGNDMADFRPTESASRDWVAEWGFGVSTRYFSDVAVGPDLKGRPEQPTTPAATSHDQPEPDDPNVAILAGLTDDETSDYLQTHQDCASTLRREGLDGLPDEGPTAELLALTGDLGGEISPGHPRIAEHEQIVADCVADAGHRYTSLHRAIVQFEAEILDIGNAHDASSGRAELTESELAAVPDQLLPDDVLVQVAEVQQREIELAVATWDCGSSEAVHWELVDEILRVEQRDFVEAHRDQLEPYRRHG
jgi:hypothetical protein